MIGIIVPLILRLGVPQRFARLAAGIALGAALIALLVAMWLFWDRAERNDDESNQQIGRTEERAEQQTKTIETVKEANDAREEIHAPGAAGDAARYDQCLRSARNPENCRFLLPQRQAD